jgi:hypothetical protein
MGAGMEGHKTIAPSFAGSNPSPNGCDEIAFVAALLYLT